MKDSSREKAPKKADVEDWVWAGNDLGWKGPSGTQMNIMKKMLTYLVGLL